ncbi:MAG: glycosyltransferase family 39 protein [Candidatus Aenigmarchaeota archaeon]|nr:glycosyltransferase family 39 protein [Candidatus Aenigmarchaeota archaeon]
MKKNIKRNHWLLLTIIIILMAAVPLLYFYNANQGYWWDEAVYLGLAKNIYEGQGYWINKPWQESFRPPVFAHMTACMWQTFGFSEPLVKFIPPLFGILSVVILYFFVRRLYGDREIVFWSCLLLATSHMFLFYSEKFLTESFFFFLITLSLYTFYLGFDKSKWFFPISAAVTAIAFLTRYPALIIIGGYVLYPIYFQFTQKNKNRGLVKKIKNSFWIKSWPYWLGFVLFLLILIPWFQFNMMVFESPIGAMFTGLGTVTGGWYVADWYYYFTHWTEIFGLVGIFAIPGIIALLVKRNHPNTLILLVLLLSLIFFMIIPRKESRYLLNFFPIYMVMIAVGIKEFRVWVRSNKTIPAIAIIFILINFAAGVQMIARDIPAGSSLKEAGWWIGERIPEGTTIMSQNVPQLFYASGERVVYFPDKAEGLQKAIQNWSVSYIVIEAREPTYPEWVWSWEGYEKLPSNVFDQFEPPEEFQEYNKTYVWVYKVAS